LSFNAFQSSAVRGKFSHVTFTRGFTRLTLLSCAEKVGVLFARIVLVHTDEGKQLLEQVLNRQQRKNILKGEKLPNTMLDEEEMFLAQIRRQLNKGLKFKFSQDESDYKMILEAEMNFHGLGFILINVDFDRLQTEYLFF
jgi:predicted amidohydrolase